MTKILLCLLACLCIANITYSIEFEEIIQSDELTSVLLSTRLGTDSKYKTLLQIQNAAYRMSERRLITINEELRTKLLRLLKIASDGKNTEKVYEIIGKLLYVIFKMESKETLESIVSKFERLLKSPDAARKRRDVKSDELFEPIFNELLNIKGGVTLMFAVDTTGSMRAEIDESKQIATDIVNTDREDHVDYILSPFNDPDTGPVLYRENTEKNLILDDIQDLPAIGGGDCGEFAYKGMRDAFQFSPQPGSSMFVFTDAPAKDGTRTNVETLVNIAKYDDIKISFFLSSSLCSSPAGTDATYHEVANKTGGTIFTFEAGSTSGRRRRRSSASSYSSFVESSLRGTSLIKLKPTTESLSSSVKASEYFDIDESISFVTVVVTSSTGSPESVILIDAAGKSQKGSSATNAIAFNIDNPVVGQWKLNYIGSYGFKIYVAFKSPIAIDVKYFYPETRGTLTMVSSPMKDAENTMMINLVGGDKVKLSDVTVALLGSDGKVLHGLPFEAMSITSSLKLKVKLTPPNQSYRVRVTGVTKKGYMFERLTNELTEADSLVFKTIIAGDEYSATIGSKGHQILTFAFVKETSVVTAEFSVDAKFGTVSVRGGTGPQRFRRRKVLDMKYDAPSEAKFKGKSDYIDITVNYAGAVTTHRLSVLLA